MKALTTCLNQNVVKDILEGPSEGQAPSYVFELLCVLIFLCLNTVF
jgi:hypothetical protein